MAWDLSCRDWRERIVAGRSLIPPLPGLDLERAKRSIDVFNRLRLPDVPGMPRLGEVAGDWNRDVIGALHGALDRATGERHIREIFELVPKKNSKTTKGAAIMVTSLLMNERPRAEFLLVAPTQAVAEVSFKQAAGMIDADEGLQKLVHVQSHLKKLTYRRTGASLQVRSFDPKVLTGVKPAGVLIDELHVVAAAGDADRVIGQIRGGLISQPEAFLIFITTQSERPPAGVFRAELNKARAIRDGRATGAMLPVLYEFPEEMIADGRWRDPKYWWMVNPNHGRSLTIERLAEDWDGAQLTGEEETRRWASQHLNVEIGLALRSDRWVGADFWERRGDAEVTLDAILERCDVATVGIDGGGLDDLLGFAVIGRDRVTREWLHWSHAWAHSSVLERRKSEAPRIRDLEKAGCLTVVEYLGEDITAVVDLIVRLLDRGLLPEKNAIGVDPVGIGQIVDELAAREVESERTVGVPQGWKLSGAIKTTERKLADGTLSHGSQELMAWAVGNAKVEPKGNAVSITKQASGTAKIDPLMATFNAVALMSMNPTAKGRSYLESGELLVL